MRIPAAFLLVVGCIWSGVAVWLFLALGGISEPAYIGKTLLATWWLLIGPVLLVAGSALLRTSFAKTGASLAVLACLLLTIIVAYQSLTGLKVQPLQAPPSYAFYVSAIILTLLSDISMVAILRSVFGAGK